MTEPVAILTENLSKTFGKGRRSNEALFVFDSLTDLKAELAAYFNSI